MGHIEVPSTAWTYKNIQKKKNGMLYGPMMYQMFLGMEENK